MSRLALNLTYELEMLTAFHIGTGYGLAGVVDERTARAANCNVYVPGSSVKGRARYHLGLLAEPFGFRHDGPRCQRPDCPLCALFGSPRREATLIFSDAALAETWDETLRPFYEFENRYNVALSRRRGVALEKLLFGTEVGAAGLRFQGRIEGHLDDSGQMAAVGKGTVPHNLALLVAALRAITHLGGRKSRGLGRCRVEVSSIEWAGKTVTVETLLDALGGRGVA
jgi:CRISPR/Cas system CSM-associated protein Csm3 (group 7 of RAMP superfamily)